MDKRHVCKKQNLNIFRETTRESIFMNRKKLLNYLKRNYLNEAQKLEARRD